MSKKLTINITQGNKSKSVSSLKSPLYSGNSSSFTTSPLNKSSPNTLFQELQMMKCENLKELNARKHRETLLFHKLLNSIKNSEIKEFLLLEEKYQEKKKDIQRNFEDKAQKLRESIEKAKEERENIKAGIEVQGVSDMIKELAGAEGRCSDIVKDVAGVQIASGLNSIHSSLSNIIDNKSADKTYKDIYQHLAKSISELQQKALKVSEKCEERKKYRENLQRSLNSN